MVSGATAKDWQRFVDLGLTEDLLPVVSDTSLPISPRSRIKDAGKTPSVVNGEGHIAGLSGWTEQRSTQAKVRAWAKDGRLGICVQTRQVRALDVDIADPAVSAEVRELVEMVTGPLPCRSRSNSGKLLLAFRMPGDFSKQRIKTAAGMIEFLANGQQFIAVGTHPSGARYEWAGLDDGIPTLTHDEFLSVWHGLAATYGTTPDEAATTARSHTSHNDPVLGLSDDDIRTMLALLNPAMEYDDWLKVGQAIHHETRGAGMHLWDEWSKGGEYPGADMIEYKWSTFGRNSGNVVTGKTLHHMAGLAAKAAGVALNVLSAKPDEFPVVEAGETMPLDLPPFARDKKGGIEATVTNTVLAVRRPDLVGLQVAYDEFRDEITVAQPGAELAWRPMTDSDAVTIRMGLEAVGFKAAPKELTRDACVLVAAENSYDSAQLWLGSLQWDGVPRVERFLIDFMGCEDTPYTRAVALYMWSALAGRVIQPGVKADMVPIYEGDQGLRKSSSIEALSPAPEFFVELDFDKDEDDTVRSLRGALVGEVAELSGLHTRQIEWIKKFVVRKTEKWIPKYKEFATTFPRRLLFIGTTNRTDILADETGNRRWLPVHITKADVEGIVAARDQLWAEGAALFRQHGVMWHEAERLGAHEHADYTMEDAWETSIAKWLASTDDFDEAGAVWGERAFTTHDVLSGALRLSAKEQDRLAQKRVSAILRTFGYEQKTTRINGVPTRAWRNAALRVSNAACNAVSVSDLA